MAVDDARALAAYKIGAEAGHAGCQCQLGSMLEHGRGIDSPDYEQALKWYRRGAVGGDADCQFQLGHMLSNEGYGVGPPDDEQALVWLKKAAAQDHPQAIVQLAHMAAQGYGQPASCRRAREGYQRAIGLGCTDAVQEMETLNYCIQEVTRSHAGNNSSLRSSPPSLPAPGLPPAGPAGQDLRHLPPRHERRARRRHRFPAVLRPGW